MEKEQFQSAFTKAKDISEKRNFKQTYDLIMNLKGLDLKKPEHQVDLFIALPHQRGKKIKICAFVEAGMEQAAKSTFDMAIASENFSKYSDKKEMKKLANSYDFFVAQATIMAKIATAFGRVFGPRGKMPNPKSGGVFPPNANLKPLQEKLQKTIRVSAKTVPLIQCPIGVEDMKTEDLIENAMTIYNAVLHALPNEKHNIKDAYIKLTMGKPVKLGEKLEAVKEHK
jgi:large subunit ribosomal protein L1